MFQKKKTSLLQQPTNFLNLQLIFPQRLPKNPDYIENKADLQIHQPYFWCLIFAHSIQLTLTYGSYDAKCENREWLSHLIKITANELPEPKPKTKKKAQGGKPAAR